MAEIGCETIRLEDARDRPALAAGGVLTLTCAGHMTVNVTAL